MRDAINEKEECLSPKLSTIFMGIVGCIKNCTFCMAGAAQLYLSTSLGDKSQLSTQSCGREIGQLQTFSANFRKLEG